MIAMEAHVYAYYLHQAKGRMSDAARLAGVNQNTFAGRTYRFGLNFRNFRGLMCECKKGRNGKSRCEVCAEKNRASARERYRARKGKPIPAPATMPSKAVIDKTSRMLFLSAKMSALQRFIQLSK